jgi:hypothetical protein
VPGYNTMQPILKAPFGIGFRDAIV